jgi:hypothetical protein
VFFLVLLFLIPYISLLFDPLVGQSQAIPEVKDIVLPNQEAINNDVELNILQTQIDELFKFKVRALYPIDP